MNAIITGATKGIGKAIALKLAHAGYNLALCSRSQQDIDIFCKYLESRFQIKAIGLETDLSNPDEIHRFVNYVQQHFETSDVLVNNAGVYYPATLLEENEHLLLSQMQINLYAPYYLCKFFGRIMKEKGKGNIINICSVASKKPVVAAGSYSVTKAALLCLTSVLREELMQDNVKVTAIVPGSTLTESWGETSLDKKLFIDPEDIAEAVLQCLRLSNGANLDEIVISPVKGQI